MCRVLHIVICKVLHTFTRLGPISIIGDQSLIILAAQPVVDSANTDSLYEVRYE